MPKPLILFFNPVRYAIAEYAALSAVASTEVVASRSRAEFFHDIETIYKDAVAIYRTSASGAVAGPFDAEFINKLPPSLKFICHNGAGYDQIDIQACTHRSITVTHAPSAPATATADLTIFLLLGALRQLNPGLLSLRRGTFKTAVPPGYDPAGKTLGILGMSRIGRAVAARAAPFGMRILYHSRSALPEAEGEYEAEAVSFERLLRDSDVLSIHVPLSGGTKHLIGEAQLAQMKRGVVVVNTARGGIIDEAALAAALEEGHVGAVGLDVYEEEPAVHPGLVGCERAMLVPHLGTHTVETSQNMEAAALENVRRSVSGEGGLVIVPEQVGKRMAG